MINENQRLSGKLLDWAITSWSRQVTDSLDNTAEYPTFAEFARFVEREARIACQPVASISVIRSKESSWEQKHLKEDQKKGVREFVTDTSLSESETPARSMGKGNFFDNA